VNLLLLDADVIIDLHKLGLWEKITERNKVYIPSTIIQEVEYYDDELGRQYLNLKENVGKTIQEVSATPKEIAQLKNRLSQPDKESLDPGESEAITILDKNCDMVFCSSDQLAIISIVLLNMEARVISLERLLKGSGLTTKKLEYKSSEKKFQSCIKIGQIRKIQNTKFT
jgi:predicted nucleic acid-binding protein